MFRSVCRVLCLCASGGGGVEAGGKIRPMAGGDHVKAQPSSVKFTYDDFVNFPDDGKRHEIIAGEHYVTPSPNTKHQAVVGNLHLSIAAYLKARQVGYVFMAPFDVLFSDLDVVEPDLLYVSKARLDVLTTAHVRGAPDLCVEVLSIGTRRTDEITKRKLYERFGVEEYWVVDPDLDAIKIYRRAADSTFVRAAELSAEHDDVLTTPLLPGWSAQLSEILATPV
jgi:Uma2 family endonuclease